MQEIEFYIVKQSGNHITFRKTLDCRLLGIGKNISFGGSYTADSANVSRLITKGYGKWLRKYGIE